MMMMMFHGLFLRYMAVNVLALVIPACNASNEVYDT